MTLKELIYQEMSRAGVQEATAFRVTIPGEEPLLIANDNHPALAREVGDGSGIVFERIVSAKAGYSSSVVGRAMEEVKTDISLSSELLNRAEVVASEMEISRSRLFAVALEEFLRRREDQRLLDQINDAYIDFPDPEEQKLFEAMRHNHRRLVEGEW